MSDWAQIRYGEVCMLMSNCGLTLDEAKQRVRNHYSRDDEMPTERDLE